MHYYIKLQQSHSGKWNVLRKSLIPDIQESNKIHVRGWKLCKCPLIFRCLQLCFQRGGEKGQALPQLLWACWIEERKFSLFLLPPTLPHNPKDLQRVWEQFHLPFLQGWLSKLLRAQPLSFWNTPVVLQHPGRTTLRTQEQRRQRRQRQSRADGQ